MIEDREWAPWEEIGVPDPGTRIITPRPEPKPTSGATQDAPRGRGKVTRARTASPKQVAMRVEFKGALDAFQALVARLGITGAWRVLPHGVHKLTTKEGVGVFWSSTKGTVWFDGPAGKREGIEGPLRAVLMGFDVDGA